MAEFDFVFAISASKAHKDARRDSTCVTDIQTFATTEGSVGPTLAEIHFSFIVIYFADFPALLALSTLTLPLEKSSFNIVLSVTQAVLGLAALAVRLLNISVDGHHSTTWLEQRLIIPSLAAFNDAFHLCNAILDLPH